MSCDERRPPPTHMGLQPTWQLFYQPLLAQKNRELNKTHNHSFFFLNGHLRCFYQPIAFAGKNKKIPSKTCQQFLDDGCLLCFIDLQNLRTSKKITKRKRIIRDPQTGCAMLYQKIRHLPRWKIFLLRIHPALFVLILGIAFSSVKNDSFLAISKLKKAFNRLSECVYGALLTNQ